MATLYAPPAVCPPSPRGVLWVLRAAMAMVAIAAWLTILLHLVLVVRAERQLAAIVRQANAFAELPQVDARELGGYLERRLDVAGVRPVRVQLDADAARVGKLRVADIEVAAADVAPGALRPLWWWTSERTVLTKPSAERPAIFRQTP